MAIGAESVTEAQFVKLVAERLDGVPQSTVKAVVSAAKEEVIDCLINGYKLNLTGLVRFEPKFVPEKKKGEPVRNPSTGETAPRAKAVPAAFKAKAFASPSVAKHFPPVRVQDGQDLAIKLVGKRGAKLGGAIK